MATRDQCASRMARAPLAGAPASTSSKVAVCTERRPSSRPTVALLVDHRSASLVAARRVVEMADALGARVDVLLAVREKASADHPTHVAHLVEALRPRHGFHVDVIHASLVEAASGLARSRPMLVVVDPAVGAGVVTSLVDDLGLPVLVAREARHGEIVAATDMRSGVFPVLSLARRYAEALGRKISYIHNARPMPVLVSDPMAGPTTYVGMLQMQDEIAAAKGARLRAFAADPSAAHLARSGSTVEAILDLARFHDADMVVVGHRTRPWWRRMLDAGVASSIVEKSLRSVLVTPLGRASDHPR